MRLEVELLRDAPSLEALQPEWERLFEASPSATPFQSPAWLVPWWRHFGNERLWTLSVRNHGELVALLPCYLWPRATRRELRFIGTGISDCLDALCVPGMEDAVAEVLYDFLAERAEDWDLCHFEQLPPGSLLVQSDAPSRAFLLPGDSCFCAELPGTFEAWLDSIARGLREEILYSRRRAERLANISTALAGRDNLRDCVTAFLALHEARRGALGEARRDPGLARFHHEAAERLQAAGLLRLTLLHWNGEPAAGVYGLKHRGRYAVYLTAFHPRFARFSLGTLALSAAVRDAINERCRELDFLRGPEPYKFRFGATEKSLLSARFPADALRRAFAESHENLPQR